MTLLATGGTTAGTLRLVESLGAHVVSLAFLIELSGPQWPRPSARPGCLCLAVSIRAADRHWTKGIVDMAIVLHAARATRDWWGPGVHRGDRMYHMSLGYPRPGGRRELREFARPLGLRAAMGAVSGQLSRAFRCAAHAERCYAQAIHGALWSDARLRLLSNRELGALLAAKRAYLCLPLDGRAGESHPANETAQIETYSVPESPILPLLGQ